MEDRDSTDGKTSTGGWDTPGNFDAYVDEARVELDDIDRANGVAEDFISMTDTQSPSAGGLIDPGVGPHTRPANQWGSGVPAVVPTMAPGWYPDAARPGLMQYWDGYRWTGQTQWSQQAPQQFHGPTAYNGGNHTTVVVQNGGGVPAKSPGLALLLTFFFGPLGMLYSTVQGALVMFLLGLFLIPLTVGLAAFVLWPIQMIWAYTAANATRGGPGQVYTSY